MPPSAGPAKMPTLSSVLDATFAAVSSAGVLARPGRSADCAGRNGAPETVESVAITYTSHAGEPLAIATAAQPISTARIASAQIITSRRGKRSASVAASGAPQAPTSATPQAPTSRISRLTQPEPTSVRQPALTSATPQAPTSRISRLTQPEPTSVRQPALTSPTPTTSNILRRTDRST